MKNIHKLLTIAILILISINTAAAVSYTWKGYDIEKVNDFSKIDYKDNIMSEWTLLGEGDYITEILITIPATNLTEFGVEVNLSNNVEYYAIVNKEMWLGIVPNNKMQHYAIITSSNGTKYTLFNKTTYRSFAIIDFGTQIKIKYDKAGTTMFDFSNGLTGFFAGADLESMSNTTTLYAGMPANHLVINSVSKFDVWMRVDDLGKRADVMKKLETMGWLTKIIYDVLNWAYKLLTLNPWAQSEDIISILQPIDLVVWVLDVFFNLIYKYPYVTLIWLLSLGNIYIGYFAGEPKDIPRNFIRYWMAMGGIFAKVASWITKNIIQIFRIIRG